MSSRFSSAAFWVHAAAEDPVLDKEVRRCPMREAQPREEHVEPVRLNVSCVELMTL